MWSFIASVIVFLALVGGLGLWQRFTRRTVKNQTTVVDQEIQNAAEIAQRRHKQRFGRESTGLMQALAHADNTGPHTKS